MEDLGRHISELLYEHDCVIVPALGGFLASDRPSQILMPNQVIFPPYRRIAFNVYLKQNDGLLANHLVDAIDVTYANAVHLIENFTAHCLETLEDGKKVTLNEVGSLYYDKERNIQFDAFRNVNHLKDSFGLEAVHFLPVQREALTEKKKSKIEKTIRPSLPAEKKEGVTHFWSRKKKVIGGFILTGALVWFSFNLYMIAPKQYESTSLNPFDTEETVISKIDSIRNTPSTITEKGNDSNSGTVVVNTVPAEIPETVTTVDTDIAEANTEINKPVTIPEAIEINKPVESTPVSVPQVASGNQHVIAGVFKIKENAASLQQRLISLGYSQAMIIDANNLFYVSVRGCNNYSEAMAMLDSLKKNSLETWIWRH